jgi:hypothetical protein
VGEALTRLSASCAKFKVAKIPRPVIKVGNAGMSVWHRCWEWVLVCLLTFSKADYVILIWDRAPRFLSGQYQQCQERFHWSHGR